MTDLARFSKRYAGPKKQHSKQLYENDENKCADTLIYNGFLSDSSAHVQILLVFIFPEELFRVEDLLIRSRLEAILML